MTQHHTVGSINIATIYDTYLPGATDWPPKKAANKSETFITRLSLHEPMAKLKSVVLTFQDASPYMCPLSSFSCIMENILIYRGNSPLSWKFTKCQKSTSSQNRLSIVNQYKTIGNQYKSIKMHTHSLKMHTHI